MFERTKEKVKGFLGRSENQPDTSVGAEVVDLAVVRRRKEAESQQEHSPFVLLDTSPESQKGMRVPRPGKEVYKRLLEDKRQEIREKRAAKREQ